MITRKLFAGIRDRFHREPERKKVFAQMAGAVASAGNLTAELKPGKHRPWSEKWDFVLRAHDELALAYLPGHDETSNDLQEVVNRFCLECSDLKDWLVGDLARLPPSADEDAIKTHHFNALPLRIATGRANTYKHHTLDNPKTLTVPIISIVKSNENGNAITLEYSNAKTATGTIDALQLAHDCVGSWRTFFAQHGIVEP